DGAKEAIATGAVAHFCFEVGTHDVMLVVDDGTCTRMTAFTIEVLTAGEAGEGVIDKVNDADFGRRHKRPLIDPLKAALAPFDRGSCGSGVNKLEAFQNKVRAQIGHKDEPLATKTTALPHQTRDAIHWK